MNYDFWWKISYTVFVVGGAIVMECPAVCWALAVLVMTEVF